MLKKGLVRWANEKFEWNKINRNVKIISFLNSIIYLNLSNDLIFIVFLLNKGSKSNKAMKKQTSKLGYFLMLLLAMTTIVSCNSKEKQQAKVEKNADTVKEKDPFQKKLTNDTVFDIKSDIENCLAKTISIIEGVNYKHKYKKGENLYFVKDLKSKRIVQLMKTLDKKTSHFKINKSPKRIKVNFIEPCEYSSYEWEIIFNKDRSYKIKNYSCVTGDFDPNSEIVFDFDLKSNSYKAKFSIWVLNDNEDFASSTTIIEIVNDVITNYNIIKHMS